MSLRRHLSLHRFPAPWLVGLALAVRLIVPAGFMPMAGQGLEICAGQTSIFRLGLHVRHEDRRSVTRLGWFLPLIVALLAGMACARLPHPGRTAAGLPSGAALIVIAPQPIPTEDQASEAYADWAGYLNDFASAKPKTLRLLRMTSAQWKAIAGRPIVRDGYATVFLRADKSALFHQGMILDPQLYRAGAAWLASSKTAPAPADGFVVITTRRTARK